MFSAFIAEVIRYIDFSKRFDVNSQEYTKQSIKTIWSIYGLFFVVWITIILIIIWICS